MYREATGRARGRAAATAGHVAYQSVLSAWRDYLTNYNDGRGMVLIGHSEGSSLLAELVATQIDPSTSVRSQLVSLVLTGLDFAVVPVGTFAPCKSSEQLDCLIDDNAYAGHPPPNARFGRAPGAGGEHVEDVCTNPANLGGGSGALDSMYRVQLATEDVDGSTSEGVLAGDVPDVSTPWIEYEKGYSGKCVTTSGLAVLAVHASRSVPQLRYFPDLAFGLHVDDPNLAMGNLVQLMRSKAAAYVETHR